MIANPLCSKNKGVNNFKAWLPVIFAVITGYLLWMQNVLQSSSEKDAVLVVIISSSVFFAYVQKRISSISTSIRQDSSSNDLTGHKKRDSFTRKVPSQLKHFSSKVFKDTTKIVRIKAIILLIILIVIVYYMILIFLLLLIIVLIFIINYEENK